MPLLSGIVNSLKRREISKFVQTLMQEPIPKLADRLILLYLSRGIPIFPTPADLQRFRSMGMTEADVEPHSIYVLHYQKGNEVALIQMMEAAERKGDRALWSALNMHCHTNLATSYDGYDTLIRAMWDRLLKGADEVEGTWYRKSPDHAVPDSPGLTGSAFLKNPRTITPHFLLPDSPISRQLEERRKLAQAFGISLP